MTALKLPLSYLLWHYTAAWADMLRLYRNLSWFLWNFFSIALLARTLLAPWKRIRESSDKRTAGFLGSLILNFITRIIGICARLLTISVGLLSFVLLCAACVAFFALWLIIPLLLLAALLTGSIGILAAL